MGSEYWYGNEKSFGSFGFQQWPWLRTSKNKEWGEKVECWFFEITKM